MRKERPSADLQEGLLPLRRCSRCARGRRDVECHRVLPYIVAQVVGAIAAAALLYVIANGSPDFDIAKGFAANGFGDHSPGKYGLGAVW